jgi:hypothetical protein
LDVTSLYQNGTSRNTVMHDLRNGVLYVMVLVFLIVLFMGAS